MMPQDRSEWAHASSTHQSESDRLTSLEIAEPGMCLPAIDGDIEPDGVGQSRPAATPSGFIHQRPQVRWWRRNAATTGY